MVQYGIIWYNGIERGMSMNIMIIRRHWNDGWIGVFSTPWCGLKIRIIQADVMGMRWEYHGKLGLNFWNTISSHLVFLGSKN